jgi:ClpP class serine protease
MSVLDILLILLILFALAPGLRQKILEASRQRMIAKIERERKSRVILLIHRQETMTFLGFPLLRYLDIQDSEQVLRAIHLTDKDVPIDLVVHTPGGLVLASLQIARALKDHPAKVTVFVPHYAMSGGTLIALAADEIVMSRHAVLGPVDPQVAMHPGASLLYAIERKPIGEVDDRTLILADQAVKATAQIRRAVTKLLQPQLEPQPAEEVADLLTRGAWTHDYPISSEEAEAMGLPVNTQIGQRVMKMLRLYPQPKQRSSKVEYLPERRHGGGDSESNGVG